MCEYKLVVVGAGGKLGKSQQMDYCEGAGVLKTHLCFIN